LRNRLSRRVLRGILGFFLLLLGGNDSSLRFRFGLRLLALASLFFFTGGLLRLFLLALQFSASNVGPPLFDLNVDGPRRPSARILLDRACCPAAERYFVLYTLG
jgi:hypothetical protein